MKLKKKNRNSIWQVPRQFGALTVGNLAANHDSATSVTNCGTPAAIRLASVLNAHNKSQVPASAFILPPSNLTVMSSPSTFDTRASRQQPSLAAVCDFRAGAAAWKASTRTPTANVNLHLWAFSSPITKSFLFSSSRNRMGSLWCRCKCPCMVAGCWRCTGGLPGGRWGHLAQQ